MKYLLLLITTYTLAQQPQPTYVFSHIESCAIINQKIDSTSCFIDNRQNVFFIDGVNRTIIHKLPDGETIVLDIISAERTGNIAKSVCKSTECEDIVTYYIGAGMIRQFIREKGQDYRIRFYN